MKTIEKLDGMFYQRTYNGNGFLIDSIAISKKNLPKCALCGKGITKELVSYTDGSCYHSRCIKWMNNNPTKWW